MNEWFWVYICIVLPGLKRYSDKRQNRVINIEVEIIYLYKMKWPFQIHYEIHKLITEFKYATNNNTHSSTEIIFQNLIRNPCTWWLYRVHAYLYVRPQWHLIAATCLRVMAVSTRHPTLSMFMCQQTFRVWCFSWDGNERSCRISLQHLV